MTKHIVVNGCRSCPYMDCTEESWDWVCILMMGLTLPESDVNNDVEYIHEDCPLEEYEKYGVVLTDKGTVDVYIEGNL